MKPKKNYKPGPLDDCYTPPAALKPLLPYLKKEQIIWECAAGPGYITNELERQGLTVISTSIETGHDFLTCAAPPAFDVILTNPPYSLKYPWITRCYDFYLQHGKPFALLLPVDLLGAAKGQAQLQKGDPKIILFKRRINFLLANGKNSGAQFPTAWFTEGLLTGPTLQYYDNRIEGYTCC